MPNSPAYVDNSWEMEEKSWWDHWNSSWRAGDLNDDISAELFGHVSSLIDEVSAGSLPRILEVACGTGILSRGLRFSHYHGLDLSGAAIEIASKKAESLSLPPGVSRPTYEAADFHDWTPPAEPFDVVMCVDAISCFRDQALVTKKLAKHVRSGGFVILTTINPFVWNHIRRPDGGKFQNGPVSHWLTKPELHGLVHAAELELKRSYTIMPRGTRGIFRLINSRHWERVVGKTGAKKLKKLKERAGLGQYRVVLARKP
jgi:2-polyprenyl-3-methyl-5-hydroxy-6-metoxy-1,4-benzoquinol methylase